MGYDKFAAIYDALMGSAMADRYAGLLRKYVQPKLKGLKILDLACGTGYFLRKLAEDNLKVGVDASPAMLKQARRHDRRSRYVRGDMASVSLRQRFNVVVCMYDAINHLLRFSQWQRVFGGAARHLELGGYFIFDFNTIGKLRSFRGETRSAEAAGISVAMTTTYRAPRARWAIEISERGKRTVVTIEEVSYPRSQVLAALRRHFRVVAVEPGLGGGRLFVICRKEKGGRVGRPD